MRVNRIDHFNLRTHLLDETCDFYEKLLELRRGRAAGMDQGRNAWMYDEQDRPIIHINMPNDGEKELPGENTGRLHHVALDCHGYDEMMKRIEDLGVYHETNFIDEIGLRQVFIYDPNGVRLELNFQAGT
jgi:catechol 2,3-dioxygenase-like lactoylglutathione lyase family enzyme